MVMEQVMEHVMVMEQVMVIEQVMTTGARPIIDQLY